MVTSCAVNYVDWANRYPAGTDRLDGVTVHRLPVLRPREMRVFLPLMARVVESIRPPLYLQREWVRLQGPYIPELPGWIEARSPDFDAAVFVTYLYYPTWAGLPAAQCPRVFHPTAHDESAIYLPVFDRLFRLSDGFGFLTPEERDFVDRRFGVRRPQEVTGIGIEMERKTDPTAFRRRFNLGDRPYIVFVGRMDPNKGANEIYRYFVEYKRRHPGPLTLVFIGEQVTRVTPRRDVIMTGFVDAPIRDSGVAGAELLIQPSRFESFSIVLCEAWVAGIPALVQGRSEVLLGQARRSGGALPYWTYAEFEAALETLLGDDALRRRMGVAGRSYVEQHYSWPAVLSSYEAFLEHVIGDRRLRAEA